MKLSVSPQSKVFALDSTPVRSYPSERLESMHLAVTNSLLQLNLPPGSCIALIGKNSVPMAMSMLGIINSPYCAVSINYKLPTEKVAFCLSDSDIKFVFYDAEFAHLVPQGVPGIEFESEFDNFLDRQPIGQFDPNDDKPSLVIYTSGSTGFPKKVLHTYRDFFQIIHGRNSGEKNNNVHRVMGGGHMFHNSGIYRFFFELFYGSIIFLRRSFNPRQFLEDTAKYHINHIAVVTPMMSMMLQQKDLITTLNFDAVSKIFLQGAYCDVKTLSDIRKVFTKANKIWNPYGLSETGSAVFGPHPQGLPIPDGSPGYPREFFNIRLVDSVLHIRARDLHTSYRDQVQEEYFNTNDMFTVDKNGFYYYIGRKDDMFKCGGEKVFPIDIESVLLRHWAVDSTVVVGLDDKIKGHKPYAFVKLIPDANTSEKQLIEYAAENLATYQIPKRIWFIDDIPMNTVGKTDRLALKAQANELRTTD